MSQKTDLTFSATVRYRRSIRNPKNSSADDISVNGVLNAQQLVVGTASSPIIHSFSISARTTGHTVDVMLRVSCEELDKTGNAECQTAFPPTVTIVRLTQYSLQHEVSAWNNRPAFRAPRPALDPE